jgi:FkbM family methyltransferase
MKARSLMYLLGFRPKPKTYGFELHAFNLPKDGQISYAQWLHPSETAKEMTQEAVDELRRFLKPGDVAIDIGAHTGDSSLPMALAVGSSGCVLALEPNKFVFPVLEKNSQLNRDKTNIIPLMFAATPEDGEYEFEYSDSGFCNGGRHEGISKWRHAHAFKLMVQGRNLESYLSNQYPQLMPRIKFIKIDAEGYDLTILTTLNTVISEYKPYVMAEIYKHTSHTQRERLFQFLTDHGYTIYRVRSESNYLGERVERDELMKWRHFDIFCVPNENTAARV